MTFCPVAPGLSWVIQIFCADLCCLNLHRRGTYVEQHLSEVDLIDFFGDLIDQVSHICHQLLSHDVTGIIRYRLKTNCSKTCETIGRHGKSIRMASAMVDLHLAPEPGVGARASSRTF